MDIRRHRDYRGSNPVEGSLEDGIHNAARREWHRRRLGIGNHPRLQECSGSVRLRKVPSIDMDTKVLVASADGAVTTTFQNDPAVLKKYPFAADVAAGARHAIHTTGVAMAFPGWPQTNDATLAALGSVLYQGVSGDAAFKKLDTDVAQIVKDVTGQ